MSDENLLIKAIQTLNGNAPERIVDDQFEALQNYFPEEYYSFKEYALCNSDTAKMYNDIRFFNDHYPVKGMIYKEATQFASQIKAALPHDVQKLNKKELDNKIDLPLGEIPTVQQAMRLFSKEYTVEILQSPVIENEEKGCLEINGKIPIKDSKELILAGFLSFSPNYNHLFQSLGLASEFSAFEAVCNKKVQWDDSYLLAVASSDVVDINEKERCLPSLGENIENCRKALYEKYILLSQLQNSVQDLHSVKAMHLKDGNEYYYTGGAITEKVKYLGINNKGWREFQFSDSKNHFSLSPREVMEFIKSTEGQQNKLKL